MSPDVAPVPEPAASAEQMDKAAPTKIVVPEGGTYAVPPPDQPEFEQVTRGISDIKDMIPVQPRVPSPESVQSTLWQHDV